MVLDSGKSDGFISNPSLQSIRGNEVEGEIVEIPIDPKMLGVTSIDSDLFEKLRNGIDSEPKFLQCVGAILNRHNNGASHDLNALDKKFGSLEIELYRDKTSGEVKLVCADVPQDCIADINAMTFLPTQQMQIAGLLRDVALPIEEFKSKEGHEISIGVKKFAERAGILEKNKNPRIFKWGGFKLPGDERGEEFDFARRIGYHVTSSYPNLNFVTGCGSGIMEAPFIGSNTARTNFREVSRFYGFTEIGILAKEAPNPLVTHLLTFPDIEKRMEAFIRASVRGVLFPGGAGTAEELMTMLSVLSNPANNDILYPFDLVERPEGIWMKRMKEFLDKCFGKESTIHCLYEIHQKNPQDFGRYIAKSERDLLARHPDRNEQLWNDELFFPPEIQEHFKGEFDDIEGLELSRDMESHELIANLRRLYSAIVIHSVKYPHKKDDWRGDRPLVRGDTDILQATDDLIMGLVAEGRVAINGDGQYRRPYRIQ